MLKKNFSLKESKKKMIEKLFEEQRRQSMTQRRLYKKQNVQIVEQNKMNEWMYEQKIKGQIASTLTICQ